ncbi:MAG: nickel-responsive transcriptional regulator NikR [Salinivirgaceae bacterium]|jgi:CopG family nickel-responsive transcriptional regulator|nr:nickel-responsive transcriptional regulator NikR [Salinivirgaceae bacterium]
MTVKRFGVSLEEEILVKLDNIVKDQRFPNRSRALRHLIHQHKTDRGIEDNEKVTGAIVLVYDHNILRLHSEIASMKHEYSCMVLSSQHIHLDDKNCIETVTVRGTANKVFKLSNKLLAIKGVKHGNIVVSAIE